MAIIQAEYNTRAIDAKVTKFLKLFGAVEITGTKWCGKTWTALAHSNSVTYVDRDDNLFLVSSDPSLALVGEHPHLIDEWQLVPSIWDVVRHAVDDSGRKRGLWILTGSSTPIDKSSVRHSGAGRIGRIEMYPMSLFESGESSGEVSIAGLFNEEFQPLKIETDITELAYLVCRGGWPSVIEESSEDAQMVLREYLKLNFSESVPRLGGNTTVARRTAVSLARNLGQTPTNNTIARDVFSLKKTDIPKDAELKETSRYIDLLSDVFMLNQIEGWVPATRNPQRMRIKPKVYFADPSIPVSLLGINKDSILSDSQTFGLAFENLVIRDLSVYIKSQTDSIFELKYYHDDSGLEVDAIIERDDGCWGAFEIKLSKTKVEEAAKSLLRMKNKVLKNPSSGFKEPSFLGVIVGTGDMAYRRPDGVYVIPINCLAP